MAQPVAPERSVILSTLMMQSKPPPREARSRPLARLVATATLAAFLLAQPWIVCAPLCLLQGHVKVAVAASQYHDHIMHCHSDKVIRSELPTAQLLGSMLPAGSVPLLPRLQVVTIRFASPAAVHLQQIPSADPPPPRSV
jgi:hypothetical protein